MTQWIIKDRMGTFIGQPDGFSAITAMENRFFVCDCPTTPVGDFVVEFPEIYRGCDELYLFDNGKRTLGISDDRIQLSEELDYKLRRAIMYTSEQLALRLDMIKWIALNVFVPDKQRMFGADTALIVQDIEGFTSDKLLKRYVAENLYYDL